jgi:hypothetical protein
MKNPPDAAIPPEGAPLDALVAGAHRAALARAACSEDDGAAEDQLWMWIEALRTHGGQEVLAAGARWRLADRPALRSLAANTLGQLRPALDSPPFAEACIAELLPLLDDSDADVLGDAMVNLGHLYSHKHGWDAALVARHAGHAAQNVRFACCFALGGVPAEEQPLALATLIQLMDDESEEVRDWAAFGASVTCSADSPELRAALVARLDDPVEIVRAEAILGLARRHDPRAHPAILEVLDSGCALMPIFEAAEAMPSPDFIDDLKGYLKNDPECSDIIEALQACEAEAAGRRVSPDRPG